MKKTWTCITMLVLLALLFGTSNVLASPATLPQADPNNTPGAQATQRAIEKATQGTGNAQGRKVNYQGTITAVDAGSLTITLKDGSTVSLVINAETRIKIPTLGNTASAADLSTGMKVQVQAQQADDGTLTARRVTAIPGKPERSHHVGTVTAYTPAASITILAVDGEEYTFSLDDEVRILPAERADQLVVGARVTIISRRDVTSDARTTEGFVVHPAPTP